MYTREITVKNEVGLHARPATYFIQKANEFKKRHLGEEEEPPLRDSPAGGAQSGHSQGRRADGSDEKEAVDALAELD